MKDADVNYARDVERLRNLELGDRYEPYVRFASVGLAGVLIAVYTGWISPLFWAAGFFVSFALHTFFIATRKAFVSRNEILVAALLFANLQISYSWLPVLLFIGQTRELMLVGGVLIAAQLLFLVRRCDTLKVYNTMQVAGLICMSVVVYIGFVPDLETPFALFGAALTLVGLNYYFWQGLRTSRRMRIDQETAAHQAHQAQKMAAVGQLAGGVAHDFNNNLTAIIGSLEILQVMSDVPDHQQDIDNALVAARQAAKTVKQLMLFARVEKPNFTVIRLGDIFAELAALTQRLIPASVTVDKTGIDPDLVIRADLHQLLTGLINLVVNGVDAMPRGGMLRLEARHAQIRQPEPMADGAQLVPGGYALITVADSGHGIPPSILPNVIDPFFTTKPVGKGTGLGLSMVAGMMREFGGGLSIQSDPDGTRVTLFLPMEDRASKADMREPGSA